MKYAFKQIMAVVLVVLMVLVNTTALKAQETIDDNGISVLSLGEDGETILVRGTADTVGDYGDVTGYEITSAQGTNHIEYRDNVHHCMTVTNNEGSTIGYCMQPYMNGPGAESFVDYNYVEGLQNSTIFSSISDNEKNRWRIVYIVSTKYGFGGMKANPNSSYGRNIHDGGTYGTYLVKDNNGIKAVDGLMIGGKVYEMTDGEAMALTQTVVHYAANRLSQKTITDFRGYDNPDSTSEAFLHMKAFADFAGINYDNGKNMLEVSDYFDDYDLHKTCQRISWEVFDYSTDSWNPYSGQVLRDTYLSNDSKLMLRVNYYSKNMCNKLLVNSNVENVTVNHSYLPFLVPTLNAEARCYDYFTVYNNGSIPITVTYESITAGKEHVVDNTIDGKEYDMDTFSQSAIVEIDGKKLMDNGGVLDLSVSTGVGATAAPCFDESIGRYSARMFSSANVQDCLMIASNLDTLSTSNITVNMSETGSIRLDKISARTDITDNNGCYNYSGATYKVYSVSSNSDIDKSKHIGTFTTNSDGVGIVTYSLYNSEDVGDVDNSSKNILGSLPFGWYMICEESGPTNGSYIIDDSKYYVCIDSSNYKEVHNVVSKEQPCADPIPFEIVKQGVDGNKVGMATLEGAQFTVYYYKGYYDSYEQILTANIDYDRKWIFETRISQATNNATCIIHEDLLLVGSDEPYRSTNGSMILPLGTIVVKETKAPEGYTLEDAKYSIINTIDGTITPVDSPFVSKIVVDNGTVKLNVANKILVDEQVVRGDLKLIKVDGETGKPMAGIPFSITSKTTGESHIVVTDKNGIASTWAKHIPHSFKTNENDQYDEQLELEPTGVWFSGSEAVVIADDSRGALPYDDYIIRELPCKANAAYYINKEFEVSIRNNEVYEYGTVTNERLPEIKTKLFDSIDGDKVVSKEGKADISLVDKVTYKYLETGKIYVLKGMIIDKATKKPIKLKNGESEIYVEFEADGEEGVIEVPFEFSFNVKDCELVAFEYLYEKGNDELITAHADISASEQTVEIQLIVTTETTTETTTEEITTETTTETTTEEITTETTTETTTEEITTETTTETTTEEITTETTTVITTEEQNTAVKGEVKEDFAPKTGDYVELHIIMSMLLLSFLGGLGIVLSRKYKNIK